MKLSLPALALAAGALLAPSAAADETWFADSDKAAAAAKAQGKDLLVDFTGSDWCGWCIRLHKEVFDHDEWSEAVQRDYVLVALDFPRGEEAKAKVPSPERNAELQQLHAVRGFPTILLMTADGDVYGRTGYQPGGPTAYLDHMAELRKGREGLMAAKELEAAFEGAADDGARWALWEGAVVVFEEAPQGAPYLSRVAGALRWALEADAKNEKGARMRSVKALLMADFAEETVLAAVRELDPKNEHGLMERAVMAEFQRVSDDATMRAAIASLDRIKAGPFLDREIEFLLNLQAAAWSLGLGDEEATKAFAERAKAIGTDNARLQGALKRILGE